MQDRPDSDSLSSDLSSTKKTQWVGWTVNSTEWRPFKKWLPEACKADFLFAQETHLPKDALATEESWMRASALPVAAAMASRSPPSRRRTAALRHGLATPHGGVGDRGIELCKGRVLAFYHSGTAPGGALILSVYMHTGAGPIQENWQILSTIG